MQGMLQLSSHLIISIAALIHLLPIVMASRALSVFWGLRPHGSDSLLQTLALMKLKEPQGGARKADKIWPLSAIWRMGRLTLGTVESRSPPFSNSHSRVEKTKTRPCFEAMPHPAKIWVKKLPVTRTGETTG